MNLPQHPELLDRLASAYALGTLRGGARRRFEALAREQAPVRAAALIWQSRVASMNELQAPVEPSPVVWTRIHNLVRAESEQVAMAAARTAKVQPAPGGWLRSLALWRGTTAAGALATVLAVVTAVSLRDELGAQIGELQTQLSAQPQIEYVAVLNDEQASASMLVTFDPKNGRLT
ncbi:MAG: RNA polymerase subunit sigma-70, partial [Hydrogenophaga sp.]|nr:RNA polymerase subunit sigma-70 [Hydrogenophaga sp.]